MEITSVTERQNIELAESALLTNTDLENTGQGNLDLLEGKHCHYGLCRQFTFLPYNCTHCSHPFCKDHFQPASHECKHMPKANLVPVCPKCDKALRKPKNKTFIELLQIHQDSGCKKYLRDKKKRCNAKRCKKPQRFSCADCGKGFCTGHRWGDLHNCKPVVDIQMRNTVNRRGCIPIHSLLPRGTKQIAVDVRC